MEKIKEREHDFVSKLRQDATLQRLKDYIQWQRKCDVGDTDQDPPLFSPISINLDLTTACNFSCPFCVDSTLINTGKSLTLEEVQRTIDILHAHGLLSVILIGGGEPTLHPDIEKIIRYIKNKNLQVGIVTNGTRLERIETVVKSLKEKDWIRISVDAGEEETFKQLHRPRTKVTLTQILEKAKRLKKKNPIVSLGYSFVIVWEGLEVNGRRLPANIHEIAKSVEMAKDFSFDYVSVKPCLIRMEESHRETLMKDVDRGREKEIIDAIKSHLEEGRRVAGDAIKILESSNLKAMLHQEVDRIKRQPKRCHMQFFRTVVSPFGIFHCPAFRGVEEAKIGGPDGYFSEKKLRESLQKMAQSILTFDASEECKDVGCFYHHTNWWLEEFILSKEDLGEIERIENDNFFL
ncbi:MAG: radical SAM protein [Syntrophaceae bacterium]|nr:radical SAM protein [Syntrophaceae bacterium]